MLSAGYHKGAQLAGPVAVLECRGLSNAVGCAGLLLASGVSRDIRRFVQYGLKFPLMAQPGLDIGAAQGKSVWMKCSKNT